MLPLNGKIKGSHPQPVRSLSITSTLPEQERRVERAGPRAEAPPTLRAPDTFSTTKHVSLCNAVSTLNTDLFKDFAGEVWRRWFTR